MQEAIMSGRESGETMASGRRQLCPLPGRISRLSLSLTILMLVQASPGWTQVNFHSDKSLPIRHIASTIASIGELNVVVDPELNRHIRLDIDNVLPLDALRHLARSNALNLYHLEYVQARDTYLLTRRNLNPQDLRIPPPAAKNLNRFNLTFPRPTALSQILSIVKTISQLGLVTSLEIDPSIEIDLRNVNGEEALYVIAQTLDLNISRGQESPNASPVYTLSSPTTPDRDLQSGERGADPPRQNPEPIRSQIPSQTRGQGLTPEPLPPPLPPPLFSVTAITSSDDKWAAIVNFENTPYIVEVGSRIPTGDPNPRIEIKTISREWVTIFDRQNQRIIRRRVGH